MRGILFVVSLLGLLTFAFAFGTPAHAVVTLPPNAIVVDEGAPEFVRGGPAQYWQTTTAPGTTYHNGQLFWTYNNAATIENHARWTLPATANVSSTYEVYVFVPGNNATTRSAHYVITHSGPTVTRTVDQNAFFAEWVSLGVYTFTTPAASHVYLSDATGEVPGAQQVGFDAVAFVPVGAVTTPPVPSPPITATPMPSSTATPSPTPTPSTTATSSLTPTPSTTATPSPTSMLPAPATPPVTATQPMTNPIGMIHALYLPALLKGQIETTPPPTPPPTPTPTVPPPAFVSSLSRYVSTLNPTAHTRMGCESGQAGQAGTIILDFGQPLPVGFGYGTLIFDYTSLASTQAIGEAAKAFARGFVDCASGSAALNLAIGTSNYGGGVNFAHGKAWAQMINGLETWRTAQPEALAGRITFVGANDIEPSWNTATVTRDWVQGYASAALQPYFNYGSCDGCPSAQYPNWQPNNGWTLEDVWFVSNGSNIARPFPEIYATGGIHARQWHWVSLYAVNTKGKAMDFAGMLTQWQACQDTNPVLCRDSGLDNTPQQGWQQMQNALNSDARTAQLLPSPSDISWQTSAGVAAWAVAVPQGNSNAGNQIARQSTSTGYIVDEVQAPLPAQAFIAHNVWVSGSTSPAGEMTYIFAGQARDPQGDGLDERHGAAAIVVRDANGQFNRKRTLILRAPHITSALHIVAEHAGILELRTDEGAVLYFDAAQQTWRE